MFWLGLVCFFFSLLGLGLAVLLWWPMAFGWDSGRLPISGYIDLGFGIVCAAIGALSTLTMLVSGVIALFSYGKSNA